MRKVSLLMFIWIVALFACACNQRAGTGGAPTPVETDACCLHEPTPDATLLAESMPTATQSPTLTVVSAPEMPPVDHTDPTLLRQGARFGSLAPYGIEDVAVGRYNRDYPSCGEPYLETLEEQSGEIFLTLTYTTPVLPERIEIFTGGKIEDLRRVEALNSLSGLGKQLFQQGDGVQRERLTEGACSERLVLVGNTDFEVDTLILSFANPAAVAELAAVELWGRLEAYVDVPVFWRAPLADTPVDLATGQNSMVYAVTEPQGLFAFDVEGNPFKQYSVLDEAVLTSVAADGFGNVMVTESGLGRFLVIGPDEAVLAFGNTDSLLSAAVSPADGNLYLLGRDGIDVFTTDTAEALRQIPLDESHLYAGLAFDSQGRLYSLRDFNWAPVVAELDPFSGEELNAIPLLRSNLGEIVARDLAIDGNGYVYILFQTNTGQVAIHKLDRQGNLVARFGRLAGDLEEWEAGVFMDPRAIAVTDAGNFIYVADGFGGSAFLTAFWMEQE